MVRHASPYFPQMGKCVVYTKRFRFRGSGASVMMWGTVCWNIFGKKGVSSLQYSSRDCTALRCIEAVLVVSQQLTKTPCVISLICHPSIKGNAENFIVPYQSLSQIQRNSIIQGYYNADMNLCEIHNAEAMAAIV